jgi:Ataxin-1 and HBP1 module (AXH)
MELSIIRRIGKRTTTTFLLFDLNNNKFSFSSFSTNRSPLGNNSFLNFTRGSLIELSNGTLRRVEDLRTEDFIMSAEKSPDLQLADSTVVKIMASSNNNYVMITFSYDNSRSKVRSVSGDATFFVGF